jgi:aspartyl-tRNA(Asn)/glutamyl-tRNA(Gln) amidotransferase subunit A
MKARRHKPMDACPRQFIDDIRAAIAQGELASGRCVDLTVERARRFNPKLGAFVELFGSVRTPTSQSASDLHLSGVTIAVKDLFDVQGFPTRAGSRATGGEPKCRSADVVARLEAAGATIIGKTHTVEFGFGGWGTNPVFGTPWNPWDMTVHRVPGGSSSGSAVAVAAGLATAALGTDTGGSIRTPASYCGVVGVKPSPGLISKDGVFALCPLHDTVGVLTRNVRDAAILLNAMLDRTEVSGQVFHAAQMDFLSELDGGLHGLRLGTLVDEELDAADEEVRTRLHASFSKIWAAGASIEAVSLPLRLIDYLSAAGDIMAAESYGQLATFVDVEPCLVTELIRSRILKGKSISHEQWSDMIGRREDAKSAFSRALEGIDALLMPTCVEAAIPVTGVDESRIVTPFGRFVNYLDLAALSIPMGLSNQGLPIGLQIVVRQNRDSLMMRIANAMELLLRFENRAVIDRGATV